jgi:hypothetical protein
MATGKDDKRHSARLSQIGRVDARLRGNGRSQASIISGVIRSAWTTSARATDPSSKQPFQQAAPLLIGRSARLSGGGDIANSCIPIVRAKCPLEDPCNLPDGIVGVIVAQAPGKLIGTHRPPVRECYGEGGSLRSCTGPGMGFDYCASRLPSRPMDGPPIQPDTISLQRDRYAAS